MAFDFSNLSNPCTKEYVLKSIQYTQAQKIQWEFTSILTYVLTTISFELKYVLVCMNVW